MLAKRKIEILKSDGEKRWWFEKISVGRGKGVVCRQRRREYVFSDTGVQERAVDGGVE